MSGVTLGAFTVTIPLKTVSEANVEYRPVAGYPAYRVGSDGSLWSRWAKAVCKKNPPGVWVEWKRLRGSPDRCGYLRVKLCDDSDRQKGVFIHILVAEAFLGPRPPGLQVRHCNGNPADCAVSNLLWGTPAENAQDAVAHGTKVRGDKHPRSKLTLNTIQEIQSLLNQGELTQREIALRYGISQRSVGRIHRGTAWTWAFREHSDP